MDSRSFGDEAAKAGSNDRGHSKSTWSRSGGGMRLPLPPPKILAGRRTPIRRPAGRTSRHGQPFLDLTWDHPAQTAQVLVRKARLARGHRIALGLLERCAPRSNQGRGSITKPDHQGRETSKSASPAGEPAGELACDIGLSPTSLHRLPDPTWPPGDPTTGDHSRGWQRVRQARSGTECAPTHFMVET